MYGRARKILNCDVVGYYNLILFSCENYDSWHVLHRLDILKLDDRGIESRNTWGRGRRGHSCEGPSGLNDEYRRGRQRSARILALGANSIVIIDTPLLVLWLVVQIPRRFCGLVHNLTITLIPSYSSSSKYNFPIVSETSVFDCSLLRILIIDPSHLVLWLVVQIPRRFCGACAQPHPSSSKYNFPIVSETSACNWLHVV